MTITTVSVVLFVFDALDWANGVEEDVVVGSTDSVCVTVDLGGGADTTSGAEVTRSGSLLVEGLVVVDSVVEVEVEVELEVWLVLLESNVVLELESDVCFYVRH